MVKNIKVVELFAGVGGFRLGLEKSSDLYETVWANQWEPKRVNQYAFDCYVSHFGYSDNHVNKDIHTVLDEVPNHDLLVGGFPCQDYSVARTQAKGIEGKKGVLWWDINEIIKKKSPKYVLLENVDRLLRSPSSQRGRDFGIMLRCLDDLGYGVEWRVINAAEYGYAQKRRRVFIVAFRRDTSIFKNLKKVIDYQDYLFNDSFFAEPFKLDKSYISKYEPTNSNIHIGYKELIDVSNKFQAHFFNTGIMINGTILSMQTKPIEIFPTPLGEIIHKTAVDEKYYINGKLDKWKYLKGAKRINRIRPNGEPYVFAEGNMAFPDNLCSPARTMLTSESSLNRSTHVIQDNTGRYRLLTPIECERLNGFDDNWTDTGMPHKFRYFCMGNALVVPLIEIMGRRLLEII